MLRNRVGRVLVVHTGKLERCRTRLNLRVYRERFGVQCQVRQGARKVQDPFSYLGQIAVVRLDVRNSGPYSGHAQVLLYIWFHYICIEAPVRRFLHFLSRGRGYILNQLSSDPFYNKPNHRLDQTHLVHEVVVGGVTHHDPPAVTSITVRGRIHTIFSGLPGMANSLVQAVMDI